MLKEGQKINSDERAALLQEFEDWRAANPRSDGRPYPLSRAAERVGVSPSVLSEVLSRKYKGDTDSVLRLIDTLLAEERQRLGRHDFRQFAKIRLTQQIFGAINTGIQLNTMPVIIAPPGSCKSAHARAFALYRGSTYVLSIEDAPADKRTVTELLCDVLHDQRGVHELAPMKSRPHRRRLESIKAWLRKRRQTVLVVDECQNLSASGLEILRNLHDGSDPSGLRCMPIVFFGDQTFKRLIGETRAGNRTKLTSQLSSRMYPIIDVEQQCAIDGTDGDLYCVDDILKITRNQRVKLLTPRAVRWLTTLANIRDDRGHLRLAMTVLRGATVLYPDVVAGSGLLDIEHLQGAFVWSVGRGVAREIDEQTGGELLTKTA